MSERRGRVIPMFALATAGCLWGTGFFFAKIALREMPVSTMVLFNLLFACVGLLPILSLTVLALLGGNGPPFSPPRCSRCPSSSSSRSKGSPSRRFRTLL